MTNLSPMMQKYVKTHEEVPDALLFYRLGDFYEMFFDDAITASKELDLTLTGRDCGLSQKAPMCGVPHHAVDTYIAKLVEKGYKVAICEQLSDPKESKGLVERGIVRIVTSGTIVDEKAEKHNENNFLMAVYYNKMEYAVAYCDVSTGEMFATTMSGENCDARFLNLLGAVQPTEVLINTVLFKHSSLREQAEAITKVKFTPFQSNYFSYSVGVKDITKQLGVFSLGATGLDGKDSAVKACGAILQYLNETQRTLLKHINKIAYSENEETMSLDYATKQNLEITKTIRNNEKKGSLLWVLDNTLSACGARTLMQWVNEPLIVKEKIEFRHNALSELSVDIMQLEDFRGIISKLCDMQKICTKISYKMINGKQLISLKETLFLLPKIKAMMADYKSSMLIEVCTNIDNLDDIAELLHQSINEECSVNIKDGNLIKSGYSQSVDEYRELKNNAKEVLARLEQKEKENTGIKNLKVKYNKVFGYYIEVTNSNIENVPDYFIRKQTLANAERYYTEELKEIETKLLSASDELIEIEVQLFEDILLELTNCITRIQSTAKHLGILDALISLAYVSYKNKYVRPKLNDDGVIKLVGARHPVVELISGREKFIPNDTYLNLTDENMSIITGPNMAGKSTYIRQVAIISLMCQIGCFVPCEEADLCIVDRIFTRVGASDDLARGQSTFMVEMSEVSNILKYATKDSLVILDEVGRGTSTYDGLSIAWSVAEYLSNKNIIGCKTLFATHYHELTELGKNEGIENYSISIKELGEDVIFLHKIVKGCADRSYGIAVAKLAGLPSPVIDRATELLSELQRKDDARPKKISKVKTISSKENEVNLLSYKRDNVISELEKLPINDMSPMEVMNFVAKLQKELME